MTTATAATTTTAGAAATASDPAEPLLARQPPHVRELTQQLRALIREVMPKATEGVHMGWEIVHYSAGKSMRDLIVALAARSTYVNIQFGAGADLPDPAHRLEGTGKKMRHVKIRSADDVRAPEVRALLTAAALHAGL